MDDNLSVMMAEKEKLNGGVSNGYSLDKSGLGFLGIFSLSLFPMLQKYSFIDDGISFLPPIVCQSTVRLGTTVVSDFLLITWLMVFQVFLRSP